MITYIECSPEGKNSQASTTCQEKNIQGFPTWEIQGRLYPGERTMDEMEVLVRMGEASSPSQSKSPPRIETISSDRANAIASQLQSLDAKLYGSYWDPHTFEQKERLG